MTDVLVTGGGGYLGQRVMAQLTAAGIAVAGCSRRAGNGILPCDLREAAAVNRLLAQLRPGIVVHCASTIVPGDTAEAADSAAANVAMVRNLIAAGARRVIYVSSMTVYDPTQPMPVRESKTAPESCYARSKVDGENLFLAAPGLTTVVLRLPGLFGPPRRAGLIHNVLQAICQNHAPPLPASPVMWAAMHVDDAAEIVVRAVQDFPSESEILNVGYAGPFSVDRFAHAVARRYGYSFEYHVKHPVFQMDLTRLERRYGMPSGKFQDRLDDMWAQARRLPK